MSYIAYPKFCVSADGYRENPERGSTLHRAEDGTPWIVNLWPETRYTFEITHPALSAEEQLELEQFYDQHIGDEVRWFNPRRQNWWRVRMVGPPRLSSMRSGLLGDVDMTLVGERVDAPTNSTLPVVSGLHQIGQVIAVSPGTWESEEPMQFEYQWLRNGEPIAGATDQNYTLVDDDLFNMISVRVTASSFGGSTSVETEPVMARLDAEVSWLYSDMAETIFVDVDGNTPATWGDPVGLVKDSSGNGNDFTQPTVTARPILGRVPRGGRTNLLLHTEQLDADTWVRSRIGAPVYNPEFDDWEIVKNSDTANFSGIATPAGTYAAGNLCLASVEVRKEAEGWGGDNVELQIRTTIGGGEQVMRARFDPVTGLPMDSSGGSIDKGTHWLFYTKPGGIPEEDVGFSVRLNAVGVGTKIAIRKPIAAYGEVYPPYQRVTSQYDVTESGVPEVHYLSFDLTDDNLTTTLPAIENGTVVIAGTNGIWIDDDYNFDGGTFSIGPTTYTGGPEGILEVIGEPIVGGFLVINRQLSQLERDLVIEELKERGAPGAFELGPELTLVSEYEGTPITDPGNNDVDGTAVIATGLLAGVSYRISYTISGYDGDSDVGCAGAATTGQTSSVRQTSNGSYTMLLTPTVTGSLSLFTRRRNTATFTNVSLRQLELVP